MGGGGSIRGEIINEALKVEVCDISKNYRYRDNFPYRIEFDIANADFGGILSITRYIEKF